ncbi:SMI1/KNR4 family protein [Plantactinospora endophytica]|uniref:SMI1/KNR4 family protein n=1 Tax=Plantactinospora endophytica TaxID=673535 RepID=UPI001942FFC3|nr:SMI1/KNR4 family protein [Plantactinospora endophytica]
MDLPEFDALAEPLRQKSAASEAEFGFALIEGHTATADEIATAERRMAVILPQKYKTFMMRHGGGAFGFIELFPITASPERYGNELCTVNDHEFPDRDFVAVAPVGTGDHWGFPVTNGRCHDEVWFRFHDAGDDELVAPDFLHFVAIHGLRP